MVCRHPTPEARHYSAVESSYVLPQSRVNLAYFGVFYATRGLSEVWQALQRLDDRQRERILLHVFTNKPDDLNVALRDAEVARRRARESLRQLSRISQPQLAS